MDFHICGVSKLVSISYRFLFTRMCLALLESSHPRSSSSQRSSNSILMALLGSHYTELVEKVLLLHTLEQTVGKQKIAIFIPRERERMR
ncbi:hypothetical protein SLA2020_277840 [Shorea laevis]